MEHILWTCESTRDVWAACNNKIQKCPTMEMTFASIITILTERLDVEEIQMVAAVARLLWLRRNRVVFLGEFTSPIQMLETASSQLEKLSKVVARKRMGSFKSIAPVTTE